MQKLLNIALAKTLAIHIMVTVLVFIVPTGLNYLVFHGMLLIWLLLTKTRNSSPYFPLLSVLMSVMAMGCFMAPAILLPVMYVLCLPYWVQSSRYAIKEPYNMVVAIWYRIPQGVEQLFKAYTMYYRLAKKGSWHGIYLLMMAIILMISVAYLSDTTLGYQLMMMQILTEVCIRNTSSRFDKYSYRTYHKDRIQAFMAATMPARPSSWNTDEERRPKTKSIGLVSLVLNVFLYVNIFIIAVVIFGVALFIGWLITDHFNLFFTELTFALFFIVMVWIRTEKNSANWVDRHKGRIALTALTFVALNLATPIEHVQLLYMVKTEKELYSIKRFVIDHSPAGELIQTYSPFSWHITDTLYRVDSGFLDTAYINDLNYHSTWIAENNMYGVTLIEKMVLDDLADRLRNQKKVLPLGTWDQD